MPHRVLPDERGTSAQSFNAPSRIHVRRIDLSDSVSATDPLPVGICRPQFGLQLAPSGKQIEGVSYSTFINRKLAAGLDGSTNASVDRDDVTDTRAPWMSSACIDVSVVLEGGARYRPELGVGSPVE